MNTTDRSTIKQLSEDVINRIAAGEVVQRPSSVVKELIENSLDANAKHIDVTCSADGGLSQLVVSDNGSGILPSDLVLAATRFATSKLVKLDDLKSIRTFGFRGEALASASMVSRLSIVSKCTSRIANHHPSSNCDSSRQIYDNNHNGNVSACAYKMSYLDGKPVNGKPQPCSGNIGTIIKVEDLFYNIPQRKRAFQSSSSVMREEYRRILHLCQCYAVHTASLGVSFSCRKKAKQQQSLSNNTGSSSNGGLADLNTKPIIGKVATHNMSGFEEQNAYFTQEQQDLLTKDVIGNVFGIAVSRELLVVECSMGDVESVEIATLKHISNIDDSKEQGDGVLLKQDQVAIDSSPHFDIAFRARGFITNGSYACAVSHTNKGKVSSATEFILFVNGRLVESTSLKRVVESTYVDILGNSRKPPFVYLSLTIPGPHVDVNIHPTKREVALLHDERICEAIAKATRDALGSTEASSRTFSGKQSLHVNLLSSIANSNRPNDNNISTDKIAGNEEVRSASKRVIDSGKKSIDNESTHHSSPILHSNKRSRSTDAKPLPNCPVTSNTSDKPYSKSKQSDPKNLVRTNMAAPSGALEPYLQKQNDLTSKSKYRLTHTDGEQVVNDRYTHQPNCELSGLKDATVDLSIPGAFASICRCMVDNPVLQLQVPAQNNKAASMKVKKITPTDCPYTSIKNLRECILEQSHDMFTSKLRNSTFVGCVSRKRSLIQSGVDLFMINHFKLCKDLFYQLALFQFSGLPVASFGQKLNVLVLVRDALATSNPTEAYSEELMSQEDVENCPNTSMARQATQCLREHAEMLAEYFSIQFEINDGNEEGPLYLIGLPILLENSYVPSLHALPVFLLRLATEVNWEEEKACFSDICTELGLFYAEMPVISASLNSKEDEEKNHRQLVDDDTDYTIRHLLFPAISSLLIPSSSIATDGNVVSKLAQLSSLYKVFERC